MREKVGERSVSVALAVGALGLLMGVLLLLFVPQRPDGDLTALARFHARYGSRAPLHGVRDAFWLNLAGALFAWGALARLLRHLRGGMRLAEMALWGGLLLAWGGWAWDQTRGWEGELFLEPGIERPLGVDGQPVARFVRFLIPPAPHGPGRALAMRLEIDGVVHEITEREPYRGAGWTLRPRWYGATVQSERLATPLFFGADGEWQGMSRTGERVTVSVDVEPPAARMEPPLDRLQVHHHAILTARFAPGEPLWKMGIGMMVGGILLSLPWRRYNGRGSGWSLPRVEKRRQEDQRETAA